jgi:Integrase core domain.
MDKAMSTTTKREVLEKLRQRYRTAGLEHKTKLINQAVGLLSYHRKSAVRALNNIPRTGAGVSSGRPREYDPRELLPVLRVIWPAASYPCGKRLAAMLPDWLAGYQQHEKSVSAGVEEQLLQASPRTLDRLLSPLRAGVGRPSLTRPGSLLRHQIPIRGSVWEEDKPGWLEVDTVALCGGSVAGDFVWMVDGVDYCTAWVSVRAIWNRGQAATLQALMDMEKTLPFALLGLDSDNGGEFLNYHVLGWLQKRKRPVFMTRSRPYKKDDNAHVEQKNWTHVRQWFGYQRYDNPEVVELLNALVRGSYGQLLNYYHATLKLKRKEQVAGGGLRRIYETPQTPLGRVLASPQVSTRIKADLRTEKNGLNPFALKADVERQLKKIETLRMGSDR